MNAGAINAGNCLRPTWLIYSWVQMDGKHRLLLGCGIRSVSPRDGGIWYQLMLTLDALLMLTLDALTHAQSRSNRRTAYPGLYKAPGQPCRGRWHDRGRASDRTVQFASESEIAVPSTRQRRHIQVVGYACSR